LKIRHVLRPSTERVQSPVSCSGRVSEEHQIEFSPLRRLRQVGVVAEIHTSIDLRFRMKPSRDVIAGRVKEGSQVERRAWGAHVAAFSQSMLLDRGELNSKRGEKHPS